MFERARSSLGSGGEGLGATSRKWLVLILTLSVLLRLGVAFYLGDVVDAPALLTDQRSYHALGQRLISGHGFSFAEAWYPFTVADTPTAHWSFLYSLFVAGVYAIFGPHPLAVRLVQAVLGGVLLPLVVFRLSRRAFGYGTGETPAKPTGGVVLVSLASAAIAAFYAYFVLYAATLMTETFYIIAVLWSLEIGLDFVSRLRRGETRLWRIGSKLGVSLGIATLLRQSILPWVPVLFAYLLWRGWRRRRLGIAIRALGVAGVLLIAFILPWTYRNYRVYGHFLLLNSNTGYAMYSAQHPMHGTEFREFDAAPVPADLDWGNEAVMDRQLMRIGIGYVLQDPMRYLLLSLSRARAFFEFWPTPDTTLLHNLGRMGSYGLFLPFMLYGIYLSWRGSAIVFPDAANGIALGKEFYRRSGLLFLFVLVYTAVHLLTWAMVRYRLPVDAVLLPLAGLALVDFIGRLWFVLSEEGSVSNRLEPETPSSGL
jgi:hypothetical protein